ncbi:hypothetical protein [Alteraurantiacibacter aquimixticola]|uniref:Aspartate-semialdehyde dehydrogenase n=1 Tax=Alteraurantiacibacter aquimixticola TaxID=2489173 RepID=A0A4T3EZU1_9SPHN|nr:hypothetical protein [Alteraurantiacibacter aquimixticola]TIX50289.1 hypothetical protein E5222_08365 [Alteraurantiacibacter aquimixticola]
MRHAGLLLPVLLLAACGQSGEGGASGAEPDGEAAVSDAVAADEASLGPKDMIDLQASGITVPAQDGDETLEVPFGSLREATEATLAGVLGDVLSRQEYEECPGGPLAVTEYAGLSLTFNEDDRFVGWFARAPYTPADSRSAMLAADGVMLEEDSTLGEEFTIGDPAGPIISGLFAGEGDDAAVEALWAGTNCIFR